MCVFPVPPQLRKGEAPAGSSAEWRTRGCEERYGLLSIIYGVISSSALWMARGVGLRRRLRPCERAAAKPRISTLALPLIHTSPVVYGFAGSPLYIRKAGNRRYPCRIR